MKYLFPLAQWTGGPVLEHQDKAAANPITSITSDDPPFIILHGNQDPLVPLNQSEHLYAALQKTGVPSSLPIVKGGAHGGDAFKAKEDKQAIEDFLTKHLLNPEPAALTKN